MWIGFTWLKKRTTVRHIQISEQARGIPWVAVWPRTSQEGICLKQSAAPNSGKWKHFAYFCSQRENIPIWNLRKEWLQTFKFLHLDHSSIPAQVLFNWLTKRHQLNVRRDVKGDKWIMNRQGCGRRRSPYFSGSQTQYRCTSRSQKYGINWCTGLVPSNGHLLR